MFAATLFAVVAFSAYAQGDASLYEIPNGHFTEWTTDCGSTYQANCNHGNGDWTGAGSGSPLGMTKRPGTEPACWSASNFSASMWKTPRPAKEIVVNESGLVRSNATHVLLSNAKAEGTGSYFGTQKYSAVVPGFVSLATPWIRCVANTNEWNGVSMEALLFRAVLMQ